MKLSRIVLLIGLVLVLVFVASNLWALAEVDGTSIHACVGRWGRIRIVPKADCCRRYEKPLEWSIQGPQGETGPPGIAGELEIYTVEGEQQEVLPESTGEASATCDPDDLVTGGGFVFLVELPGCAVVEENFPEELGSWQVAVKNQCEGEVYITAWAVCARVIPPE